MSRKRVVILGSTGSIGVQALDVIRRHGDRFDVVGLAVSRNVEAILGQAAEFEPEAIAVTKADPPSVDALPPGTKVLSGDGSLVDLALSIDCDIVLNGVVGAAGLEVTVATLEAGLTLALANKESLVAGGPIVKQALERGGGKIVPVDSEHAASAQILRGEPVDEISRLVLTASGGPFRGCTRAELSGVTVEQALDHPTWSMGAVVTINSATLMNKGLEILEAHELFDLEMDRIGAVIHPQSIIHAVLEMVDGSAKAQVGMPDMRQPIAWALAYPDRLHDPIGALDWTALPALTFEEPDLDAFECLALAFDAGRSGGTAPAVLNASNEVAVEAFLERRCGFLDIGRVVAEVLGRHDVVEPRDIRDIAEVDRWAREEARGILSRMAA